MKRNDQSRLSKEEKKRLRRKVEARIREEQNFLDSMAEGVWNESGLNRNKIAIISIGTVCGGPELKDSALHETINTVTIATSEVTKAFACSSEPAINVIFFIPGSIAKPDWEGVRDGRYSHKEQLLMIQIAVPEEMIMEDYVLDYVIESLRSANTIAFHSYHDKKIVFPLAKAEALVTRICDRAIELSAT